MVTARVDLNSLNNELNGFEKSLDEWAHRSVAGADSQKDRHLKQLREFQSKLTPPFPAIKLVSNNALTKDSS